MFTYNEFDDDYEYLNEYDDDGDDLLFELDTIDNDDWWAAEEETWD